MSTIKIVNGANSFTIQKDSDTTGRFGRNHVRLRFQDASSKQMTIVDFRDMPLYSIDLEKDTVDVDGNTAFNNAGELDTALEPIFFLVNSGGGGGGQVDSVIAGPAINVNPANPASPIVGLGGPGQGVNIPMGTLASPMGYVEMIMQGGMFFANLANTAGSGFLDYSTLSDASSGLAFTGFNSFPKSPGHLGITQFLAGSNEAFSYFGLPVQIGPGNVVISSREGVANGNQAGVLTFGDVLDIGTADNLGALLKNINFSGAQNTPILMTNVSGYGEAYANRAIDEANVTAADLNHKPSWGFILDNLPSGGSAKHNMYVWSNGQVGQSTPIGDGGLCVVGEQRSWSFSGTQNAGHQVAEAPCTGRIIAMYGSVRQVNMATAPGANIPEIGIDIYSNPWSNSGVLEASLFVPLNGTIGNFTGFQDVASISNSGRNLSLEGLNIPVTKGDALGFRFEPLFNNINPQAIDDLVLQVIFEED